MKKFMAVALCGLFGLTPAALRAADRPKPPHRLPTYPPANTNADPSTSLAILSPAVGDSTSGSQIAVKLALGSNLNASSLQVYLNGQDVSTRFNTSGCGNNTCGWQAELSAEDGLIDGENNLRATAEGDDDRIDLDRVYFDYSSEVLGAAQNKPQYLPMAIGLQLNPGGGLPWIKFNTGTPTALKDNIDRTQYSTPYPSVSLPAGDQNCNGSPLQVAVLNRQQPTELISWNCFANSQALKSFLSNSSKVSNRNIVIVGTTAGSKAPSGLDTSSIGGTDYSKTAPNQYPQTYAMIGVPGMRAGSEYESYNTTGENPNPISDDPLTYAAGANGLLAKGDNLNYDFHPGNNQLFSISPDSNQPGTPAVTIGPKTYTLLPQYANSNGFWLLVLDRILLRPIDFNDSSEDCAWNKTNALRCGTFFNTGSTNGGTASSNVGELANVLRTVTPRQLAILVSVGQPFMNKTVLTDNFASAVVRFGGSRFTLPQLAARGATYTLMAPGSTTDRTPFSRQVVASSSVYTQQAETGYVNGVLARDQKGLYAPLSSSQVDGQQNGDRATVVTPDNSFDAIATQPLVDWPLTDSSGHIAAYHYASEWFLKNNNMSTGSHSQDLRFFYPGKPILAEHNTDFNCSYSHRCPPYPGAGYGFTEQELTDADNALYKELTALRNAYEYLDSPGLGEMFSQSNNSIALAVIQASHTVLPGQFNGTSEVRVSNNPSDWVNLVANAVGTASSAFTGIRMPEAAGALGVISGIMKEGASFATVFPKVTTNPPSYENTYDTTLADLSKFASTYSSNMVDSYAIALDTIYSDSGKLQAVLQKTSDTDSGWQIESRTAKVAMGKTIAAGTSRALYLQLLPKFYSLDTYSGQPINRLDKLGIFRVVNPNFLYTVYCDSAYPSNLSTDGYGIFPQIQGSKTDIFVIGGQIDNQGKSNASERLPSQSLLNTLFSDNDSQSLNFQKDYFYSNNRDTGGILQYRGGPDKGYNREKGYCYRPGCSGTYTGGNNPWYDCKGP